MSTAREVARGGVSVGVLSELPPLEAGAVVYLRHWFSGAGARAAMRQEFSDKFGPATAAAAFDSFGQLCNFCAEHGRRPLVRHGMQCACLGADENCFANLVASAANGEGEDALLLASLIVKPQKAADLMQLATQSGLFLQNITCGHPPRRTYRPGTATLH